MTLEKPTVWGIGGTRAMRVHWTLLELGVDYDTHAIRTRSPGTQTEEFAQLNPKRKIPVLCHGPLVLTESAAIVSYLTDTFPAPQGFFVPSNAAQRARLNEWSYFVMTELDCRGRRSVEGPVGMGSYNMDSHNVQRYVAADGFPQNEGDVQVSPGSAYSISYRALVPKKSECRNLLVPVCLSASHIAFGSIRMEPVFMVLGQSAATAASLAIDDSVDVQDLNYAKLRNRLLEDKQVLAWQQ